METKTMDGRERQVGTECLLTMMPSPVLQKSFPVKNVDCYHISFVTPDRIWASDGNDKTVLLDTTTGDELCSVEDLLRDSWLPRGLNGPEWKPYIPLGVHTVNSRCELIYINDKNEINILSSDGKTTTRLRKKPHSPWELQCVYCSPITGDLLVGMRGDKVGRVRRYNSAGELVKTIPTDDTRDKLYNNPHYITENNNGDLVVSDWYHTPGTDDFVAGNPGVGVVVVTDRLGKHRFSYTGPPPGSRLWPHAVCTDALSHILVCDRNTRTVHMLNKDGELLSDLLPTEQSEGINLEPRSLSYDFVTHLLWVGSSKTVSAYKYVNNHVDPTDTTEPSSDFGSSPN